MLASVLADTSFPTRSQIRRARLRQGLLALAISGVEVGLLLFCRPRHTGGCHPTTVMSWVAGAGGLAWVLHQRGREGLGPPEALLWLATAAGVGGPGWIALHEPTLATGRPLGTAPTEALEWVLLLALPWLWSALVPGRGRDVVHPEAQGAAWGALCACASVAVVGLAWPWSTLTEVALGQVGPALLLVGLGSTLGRRHLDLALGPGGAGDAGALAASVGLWAGTGLGLAGHLAGATPVIVTIGLALLAAGGAALTSWRHGRRRSASAH